jgi:hypothetical protein
MWLGIDWGTHSSKWFCNLPSASRLAGRIHSSVLERKDNSLCFSPGRNEQGTRKISSLKGKLILDPLGQSFWDAERPDTGTSLGAATVFSLAALLNDATKEVVKKEGAKDSLATSVEIAFALPNWVNDDDEEARAPFKHFHQAVMVALTLWQNSPQSSLPSPGLSYEITQLEGAVKSAMMTLRTNSDFNPSPPLGPSQLMQRRFELGNVGWRYIGESCAAGLPYLRSTRIKEEPGLPGLRKLLVVDIGAGSTDVGYMIKTIAGEKAREPGKELLNYLPQAGTLKVAGNVLTERLRAYRHQQGQMITRDEAESEKLSGSGWYKLPFVQSWAREIATHVQTYIQSVPDKTRLSTQPGLQIILTGGSSLVTGLKEQVLENVSEVLPSNVSGATRLTSALMLDIEFEDEVTTARRAVSIGAADRDIPALKYLERVV